MNVLSGNASSLANARPAAQVRHLQAMDWLGWDRFVRSHPHGTLYHLPCWKKIIEKSYGHRTHYLVAVRNRDPAAPVSSEQDRATQSPPGGHKESAASIAGVLPLVHLKNILFGNHLISMPFFDLGGILAEDEETERGLLSEALRLGTRLRAQQIELRHTYRHSCLDCEAASPGGRPREKSAESWKSRTRTHKVRMVLALPGSAGELMASFKSKLRSQIRKPMREGLSAIVGGAELLDAFYRVFVANMRDLGSPVHSKKLMAHLFEELREEARIVLVRKGGIPLACSLIIRLGDTLYNPWASALREYSSLSPNMLLYWTMLEYACENGISRFDFGRSTPGEGTYKFKEQWGAVPQTLHWQYVVLHSTEEKEGEASDRPRFARAVPYWRRLPLAVTQWLGPMIRKHIGL
ncbi:MAG: GNAT family N-acetyltransferase [bacterium]